MIVFIIYTVFTYLFYGGIFIAELEMNRFRYFTWKEWLSAAIAPVSFPIVLGIYMNQQK